MEQNQERRRGHFHRSRRGADRRGLDRRTPAQGQNPPARDQLDIEQIMREIRARIAQRHGIELTHQQIDDLAARRLEYILDPRAMKPEFLDRLRRTADEVVDREQTRPPSEPVYVFEDTTFYDSHRPILRFIRKLLNPLLKLFFNPNPLIRALHLQAQLNVETAERNATRDRRQAEWNALHYRIIQRLVTEVSRLSLEAQALSARVESLGGRVDFNDRRVRGLEGTMHQARPAARAPETPAPATTPEPGAPPDTGTDTGQTDVARRRRRRRRGRRGTMGVPEPGQAAAPAPPSAPSGQPSLDSPPVAAPRDEPAPAEEAFHADRPDAPFEPEPPPEPEPAPREPAEAAGPASAPEPDRADPDRLD